MSTTTPVRRLADARPEAAGRTAELVGPDERDAVLRSIFLADDVPVDAPPAQVRRRVRLATALAAPALVGIVVVALLWAGTPSADRAPSPGTTTAPAAAPVVLDRVRLAVAEADDLILHMKSDHGNGVLWEMWHDVVERRSRSTSTTPAGRPIYDHELRALDTDRLTVKVVSYGDRAWWTYVTPAERDGAKVAHGLSAADIRAQLADGTMEEIGPEALDGREVLHLRWMPHSKPGFVTVPGDMWVDAVTYLPVRSVNHWGIKGEKSTRSEYEWLPRSASSTANLIAPVPAGFVQRAGAPDDPPGAVGVG
jgi:hypothetical protein